MKAVGLAWCCALGVVNIHIGLDWMHHVKSQEHQNVRLSLGKSIWLL